VGDHPLTHKELVKRAGRWLRSIGCKVVMQELVTTAQSRETPDAIGWHHNRSILIECKASRSDYRSDRLKPARQDGHSALGHWRLYFAEPGVIPHEGLPDGWSLYEVHEKQVRHVAGPRWSNAAQPPCESDRDSEVTMLLSALRRLEISTAVFIQPALEGQVWDQMPTTEG